MVGTLSLMHASSYGEPVMPLKRVHQGNTSGGAVYTWVPARKTPLYAKVYSNMGTIQTGENRRFGAIATVFEFRGRVQFSYEESRFRYQGRDYAPIQTPLTPGGIRRDLTSIPCNPADNPTPAV